ncbi:MULTISPECIES: M48 family metallopeptidase [unclassified Leisingera]|uniref:M48 family metallopeptidase n=1 Tax=unclassified Leisingera TaxID=2614906 RepID=UPI00068B94B0|nr:MULTISPECIES: M48 family metallopeptidase [unclassified Leisingera]
MGANYPLPVKIEGRAYARLSSRLMQADLLLHLEPQGTAVRQVDIVTRDGETLGSSAWADVSLDPPLGRQPRRLTLPDGTMFETDDHDAVLTLSGGAGGDWLHALEQFRPRLAAFTALAVLSAFLVWKYGLDVLASAAAAMTPPVVLQQMDRGTIEAVDFALMEPSELGADEKERARRVFQTLLEHLQDTPNGVSFQLLFREMPGMGPNAVALPGGTVMVSDAFMDRFPGEDVLAGVLGHEIGHVVEQHGLRQVYRSLGLYAVVAFVAGDTGPLLEDILLEGNVLLSLQYGREQEALADEFGVQLAARAGYAPEGLITFFETVQSEMAEPPEWMSSHPNSAARIQSIEDAIRQLQR